MRGLSSDSVRSKLNCLLQKREELITTDEVTELESCNHIEADTRLILEASKSPNDVVIRCADTDVLMLMCYAHMKLEIRKRWVMMIDKETYVDILDIRSVKFCLPITASLHSLQMWGNLDL